MRLFVGLDIPDEIRTRIQRFVEGVAGCAPEARWVTAESLHITLKFIGEMPESELNRVEAALSQVKSRPLEICLRGCGFFPSPRRPRIFWIGIDGGPELAGLATAVDKALVPLGVAGESHPFNPHISLARVRGSRTGKAHGQPFQLLSGKLIALPPPEFGTMTAREFFLYQSRLSAEGSRYTKIALFEIQ